jgi:homocysteine S-methyltransferase
MLGDGANGTMLTKLGYRKSPLETANIEAPDLVKQVHHAYFDAGSDFVETNTYGANRFKLGAQAAQLHEINLRGAQIARSVCPAGRFVLGAIGPAGSHMQPIGSITVEEVRESVAAQATTLAEGGVDAIILESFVDMAELVVSIEATRAVTDLPIVVSKAFIEDGEALAEGLPGRCARELSQLGVSAIGANCVVGPQRMVDIVRQFCENTDLPVLAFPTPGLPQLVKGTIVYDTDPEYFGSACARLLEEGASIVGGCCGTTPEHIAHLRTRIEKGIRKHERASASVREKSAEKPIPVAEKTMMAQKLGKEFLITVELDLPRGLNVDKVLAGAAALKAKGADLIDISDGARARLRMNPMSISTLIQNQVSIEVVMHFACRDRNLLAVQADLLGCHALGIKNILAITGDPANIGDYPSATSVFDVDSIGLVRIMSRFNEGIDLAGNTVGMKCAYTIAVAFNPLATDISDEMDRLRRKADAGAHVVYTQPLFETEAIDKAAELTHQVGLPLVAGVLPLRSARHAEFMHNEVPGIQIPDWLRAKMAEAKDDDEALAIGVAEAQTLCVDVKARAQGVYLMPPFGNHRIAEQVISAIR